MKQKNEKFLLIGLAAAAIVLIGLLSFAPKVYAEAQSERGQDLYRYGSMFQSVFNFVLDSYVEEVDPEVLFEGAMKGLFESLEDPYSVFLTEDDMADFDNVTEGEYGGVGIYISKPDPKALKLQEALLEQQLEEGKDINLDILNPRNRKFPDFVEVVAPIEDTPAFRAGILTGDYITHIDGEPTNKLTIDDVVNRIKGQPGTEVVLTLLRHGTITFDVSLKRALVEVPTVKYSMMDDQTGYLRIIQFTPFTADRVEDALENFKSNNYSNLIIDLRSNPGGLLDSVVNLADYFFEDGVIVSTRGRIEGENRVFEATSNVLVDKILPIVVLIDEGSASASEILAGALKDRDRAVLFGNTSYGKGSVQQIRILGKAGLKLTMARYYTPADINIDKIGIEPDFKIEEPTLSDEELEDYQVLMEEKRVQKFIEQDDSPSEQKIQNFLDSLNEDEINLEDRLIRRMIKVEQSRVTSTALPNYDLDYDLVLKEAVKYLENTDEYVLEQ